MSEQGPFNLTTWLSRRRTMSASDDSSSSSELLIFLFVFVALAIGTGLRAFSKWTKLPYTPLVLGVGLFLGALANQFGLLGESASLITNINADGFLTIFIPALIFESAFNVEWHVFRREIWGIIILAGPGVIITILFNLLFLKVFFAYDDDSLTTYDALTIASIISPTDPVAAVSLLRELGAPTTMNTILEGASLINDGSAMVFFTIFSNLANGTSLSFGDGIVTFLRLAGGGVITGIVFGAIGTYLFSRITNDNKMLTTTSFVIAYFSFYVAEETSLQFSGVLSTVTAGVYMAANARIKLTRAAETELLRVWEWGQYVVETLIFFLTGAIIGVSASDFGGEVYGSDWWKMFLFYILMNISRVIMIMCLKPLISWCGYGITWREGAVLGWAGIRGALGLALALFIEVDSSYSGRFRNLAVFYMAGMVTLTLLINGLTVRFLVKWLKVAKVPDIKRKIEQSLFIQLALESNLTIDRLHYSQHLRLCDWERVRHIVGYDNLMKKIADERKKLRSQATVRPAHDSSRLNRQDTFMKFSQKEVEVEARFRLLTIIRVMILEKHEQGYLSSDAMRALREACNFNLDDPSRQIFIWEVLKKNFLNRKVLDFVLRFKNWKLMIGRLSQKFVGEHLYMSYDCASTLIMITEELIGHQNEIPFMQNQLKKIMQELKDTRNQAAAFVETLEVDFINIIQMVQVHRASTQVLITNKKLLEKFVKEGKIVQGEYERMVSHINDTMNNMGVVDKDWMRDNDILDCFLKFPLFKGLMDREIKTVRNKCELVQISKGECLLEKDSPNTHLFMLAHGTVTQQLAKNHESRRAIGSILSFVNVISHSQKILTTVVCETQKCYAYKIPLRLVKSLAEKSSDFKHKIYKSALFELVQLYSSDAGALADLAIDETALNHFASQGRFEEFSKDHEFSLEFGGYIYSGRVSFTNADVTQEFLNKEKEEEKDDAKNALIKLRRKSKFAPPGLNSQVSGMDQSMSPNLPSVFRTIKQSPENEPKPIERRTMKIKTSKWELLKDYKKLTNPDGKKKHARDQKVEYGKYSYVPPTTRILVATEDLKILRFNIDLKVLTDSAGENIMQKVAQQKSASVDLQESQNAIQPETVRDRPKNLYSNLMFDVAMLQKLDDVEDKEKRLKSVQKLRKYATLIRHALIFTHLGKGTTPQKAVIPEENSPKDLNQAQRLLNNSKQELFESSKGSNKIDSTRLKRSTTNDRSDKLQSERGRESQRSKRESKRSARYLENADDSKQLSLLPKYEEYSALKVPADKHKVPDLTPVFRKIGMGSYTFAKKESNSEIMDIIVSPKEQEKVIHVSP